jgi:hypothetical protein
VRQLTHPKLQWLLQLTATLKFFPILQILWTWSPSDFHRFPKLKTRLRGRRFGSNEGVNEFFEVQNRQFYFEGLNKLEHRWGKGIDVEDDYI